MRKTRIDPKDIPSLNAATLSRILTHVGPYRSRALTVIACIVAGAALNLSLPWFIRGVVDDAIPRGDLGRLWLYCAAMVAGPAAAGLLEVAQKYGSEVIGQQVMLDLRVALYRQFHAMPFAYFAKQQPGEAVSHVLNDVEGVGGAVSGTLVDVAQNAIVLLSTAAFMFALDWRLALIAIGFLPLFVAPTRRVGRTRKTLKRAVQARMSELTGILTETLSVSGALLVKVFGGQEVEVRRFQSKAEEIKRLSLEQSLVGRWFRMLLGLFEAAGPAIVFAVGGLFVIKGQVALGTLIAFVTVLKRLYGPARQLAGVHVDLMTSYAYFERVFAVLDRMPSIRDASNAVALPAVRGRIDIRNVSFSYEEADSTLSNISLEIPAGASIGIVGPSGGGKSTIASLIMRLYDPTDGSVAIDGVDLRHVTAASLRDSIAVVTQETFLFHTTVLENLKYAKPSASVAEVQAAAKRAQIHEVIEALPDGYETVVGERGYRFSAGERQRLAIARAILKDPRILILDEATSSLDSDSERKVQEALAPLCQGRTTVAIAHRLSTVRDADLIIVVDRGRVVERGTHAELMREAGLYAWLWRAQAPARKDSRDALSLVSAAGVAALAGLLLCVATPATAQSDPDHSSSVQKAAETHEGRRATATFDKRPVVRVGTMLELDVRLKSQADWRAFPAEPATDPKDVFDLHRARVGLGGTLFKRVDFQVERELRDTTRPWRDVYVDARASRSLQVQVGQFKIPFGLDQLTGSMDLDFTYRSLAGAYLAPGRDLGLMAHGRLFNDVVKYQAGVFRRGGENIRASERTDPQSNRTVAARVVVKPWTASSGLRLLRSLATGIAFTDGNLPEGLNSVRGKTVPGDPFFEQVYVNGRRQRIGAELQWRPGPTSVQAELIHTRDERREQGIDNEDLPDAVAQAWYLSGTWLLTGERKKDTITPARPFLSRGIGAVELAGRVERLTFGGGDSTVASFRGPRDSSILTKTDDVWTVGVNWYLNEYIRLQANVIREQRAAGGVTIPGQAGLWSRTFRVQFGF